MESIEIERLAARVETPEDHQVITAHPNLRPASFQDYPGQELVKENLKIAVDAAKIRGSALDHVLLHGPPGLGKTTLANIVAKEMSVKFFQSSGPSIDRPGDLVGILAGLEAGAVLFIDEIHRLTIQVEEILYSAMEDFCVDILIGTGPTARSVNMPIPPFTLIGATTKASSLSRPLRNRFGIIEKLDYYSSEALSEILQRSAAILDLEIMPEASALIAHCARGTPRIANRLLKRVRDFAQIAGSSMVDLKITEFALSKLEIDQSGLDRTDRTILSTIIHRYQGGPVGLDTLAATIGEERSTIEEVFEPFLVHIGMLGRGPRGRYVTQRGFEHINGPVKTLF